MSKNTTLQQGGQYKRKERHITALLVRVDRSDVMSPWVFYVIDVVNSIQVVLVIISIITIFGWFALWSCIHGNRFVGEDERMYFIILFITSVIAVILAILIPNRSTMIQMAVTVTGVDIDHIHQIEDVTKAIMER